MTKVKGNLCSNLGSSLSPWWISSVRTFNRAILKLARYSKEMKEKMGGLIALLVFAFACFFIFALVWLFLFSFSFYFSFSFSFSFPFLSFPFSSFLSLLSFLFFCFHFISFHLFFSFPFCFWLIDERERVYLSCLSNFGTGQFLWTSGDQASGKLFLGKN